MKGVGRTGRPSDRCQRSDSHPERRRAGIPEGMTFWRAMGTLTNRVPPTRTREVADIWRRALPPDAGRTPSVPRSSARSTKPPSPPLGEQGPLRRDQHLAHAVDEAPDEPAGVTGQAFHRLGGSVRWPRRTAGVPSA